MDTHSNDSLPHQERTCVVCDEPIAHVNGTTYVHRLAQTTTPTHRAQPALAHPMDTDPFAGADPEEL